MRRIFAALPLLLLSSAALADDYVGEASVIDGDTLGIHGARVRLWGIDAPVSSQLCRGEDSLPYRCGAQAANDLDAFIAARPVNCVPLNLDPYRRTVAACSVRGADLGEWLVRNGLALDWPQYSKGNMARLNAMLNAPAAEFERAAMSSHGSIAPASAQTEIRPAVPATRTRIREWPQPDRSVWGDHC
jgi:endonuclease YncB( thermonuclease family)